MKWFAATIVLVSVGVAGIFARHIPAWSGARNATGYAAKPTLRIDRTPRSLAINQVWAKSIPSSGLHQLGRGKGIIFSPDLSEPGNREFFRALGFAYFEDPDWHVVLDQIKSHNNEHPNDRIEVLLIQSHGTAGDGLKLQNGKQPEAPRSYTSLAALQEKLEGTGVRTCLLAACNAGRLFRPDAYRTIQPDKTNPLFEPPTLGIINASPDFDPSQSSVVIGRRAESHIEDINECRLSEFSPLTRSALFGSSGINTATKIAVPEMLIQLLLTDDKLHLVSQAFETEKSKAETDDNYREHLITRFLRYINTTAAKT